MASSVAKSPLRTPAENVRTDSHPRGEARYALDELRAGSHNLRMTAKFADEKSEFLNSIEETRKRLKLSIEAMAAAAKCPVSSMSDALAGKPSRNFPGHWVLAQGDDFVRIQQQIIAEGRRLTEEAALEADTELACRLVRLLMRSRRTA